MKNLSKIWPLGICAGLLFSVTQWVDAESAHPIENLKEANRLIHWPKGFTPEEGDAFVHNEIWINAPANVIWTNLINATEWPSWYSNSANVRISGAGQKSLHENSHFTWNTFGFPVDSKVHESVLNQRLGWFGNGTGLQAYHTWLILEKANGSEVVTEEVQKGAGAIRFNLVKPSAMYDGHDLWLKALKKRSEQGA
jgi:hypothetical protein